MSVFFSTRPSMSWTTYPASLSGVPESAASPATAPPAVPPPEQRVVGKTYIGAKGPATWTGGGWQLQASP
jgi:hypothetical protein